MKKVISLFTCSVMNVAVSEKLVSIELIRDLHNTFKFSQYSIYNDLYLPV